MLSKNQIREIQSLQLKKNRDLKKLFIAEGVKTCLEILTQMPSIIEQVYATTHFIKANASLLKEHVITYAEVDETELAKISLQNSPNQVLAICNYFEETTSNYKPEQDVSFYLDDVRDPGNMGTIIRLADWFGITSIFCSESSCDFYNPKVIQSTMGSFLRVKISYTSLKNVIAENKPEKIYGAVLEGKNLYKEKLAPGIIVIGNEANGISDENMRLLTHRITIPKSGNSGTESLNAAMATSILASEFYRQLKEH